MQQEFTEITEKTLQQEKQESNLLNNKGFKFKVSYNEMVYKNRFYKLLNKGTVKEKTEEFEIKELCLGTKDRITDVVLQITLNEDDFKDGGFDIIEKARVLSRDNSKKMAFIVALAVVGESKAVFNGERFVKYDDCKELIRLQNIFYHCLTPAELLKICSQVTSMENIADFLNSIRLMSRTKTTTPINRIE